MLKNNCSDTEYRQGYKVVCWQQATVTTYWSRQTQITTSLQWSNSV